MLTPAQTAVLVPKRTLLLTANAALAAQLERQLTQLGCTWVEVAGDGVEAGKRSLRLGADLVLIDLLLPGAGGALQAATEIAAYGGPPIVYLTDPAQPLPSAALVHAAAFADKPVTDAVLTRALAFALYRRSVQTQQQLRAPASRDTTAVEAPRDDASTRLSSELLASMAHELRAPLQGVVGFASFLRDGKAGPVSETQQQYLAHITEGGNHVLQVVNDVLDLTAADSDTLHVRTEAVDPERAAREVLAVLQVIAIRKRVEVQVSVDEQLGHVVSDATKIKQVLYNFVSNALKFTPASGRILVSLTRQAEDMFCIEVADTGVGMSDAMLASLFDAPTPGTAVRARGLSITKRIVDALGGSVAATRRPEGGCVFCARLPIAPLLSNHLRPSSKSTSTK